MIEILTLKLETFESVVIALSVAMLIYFIIWTIRWFTRPQ